MATQLFFTDAASDYSTGHNDAKLNGSASGWTPKALSTSRGAGVVNVAPATEAGPTNGVEAGPFGGLPIVWYSPPLDADVTISGSITWNLRSSESNMSANAAINGIIEKIDGATGVITLIDKTARTTELGTTEAAANFAETPAAGVACKRGDRLRVRVFADDAGTMGVFQFLLWYAGTSAGASGDSYLTLTENLTFVSEPAGSQVFLTDTASPVATASVDREAWTDRGSGVTNDVTDSANGWLSPIQVSDTAGGTVVDWFTKPLAAMTLGGAIRCNLRGQTSASAAFRAQVAVVAGDGTGPVVFAESAAGSVINVPSETAISFLISGDDVEVTDGQRIRIRLFIDDPPSTAMVAGGAITLYYAGTSGGASGDTFLTFSQTLTEFVAGPKAFPPVRSGRGIRQLMER